ncbi:MAG: NAD-dependent epimerase/dehydratase family protein [Treponema sp.]|jgi:dihydroflavonol-4-reductase|nr:NAD-dependent epimerase/dehydratase family protein [Treponema sp.]
MNDENIHQGGSVHLDGSLHVVTGAAGRTGLALCAELKSRGCAVRALVHRRNDVALSFLRQYADEVVVVDIRKPEELAGAFSGAAYVYHLAGVVSIASAIDPDLYAANVTGTENVINACLSCGVKRLVYTGTVHTLPFHDKTSALKEIPRFDPDAVHGAYAVTKSQASNLVLDAVRERGLDAVIGMPSGIIGGFELKRSNFGQMVVDVAERRLPVYLKGRYDFVDVRDVAQALADLAEKGVKGESYILSGHVVAVKDLVAMAARAAGVPPPKICLPLPLVAFFSYFAEWRAILTKQTLMFTPYAIKVLGDNCNFSHEKISALTGYSPRAIEEAIKEQVDFYFKVYKPQCMQTAWNGISV